MRLDPLDDPGAGVPPRGGRQQPASRPRRRMPSSRVRVAALASAAAIVALALAATREPLVVGPIVLPPGPPTASSAAASPEPSGETTGETVTRPDSTIPNRVDVYATGVSVVPGQPLELHVSTLAPTYSLEVSRADATVPKGSVVVALLRDRPGHDVRGLATIDTSTRTVRANWPVTDVVPTNGFLPGIYIVTARDALGSVGLTIFVVRTPRIVSAKPLFVFSSLTYEAYNLWGGANLYTYAGPPATRVSFDRPYLENQGLGFWHRGDARLVAWLQRHHAPLQYTTDDDLALAPPPVAPSLLIFGRHTEYVPQGLRDWVNLHVNVIGDMNLANFGANSFYWRVRLEPGPHPGEPLEIVGYKHLAGDPVAAANPADATVKWREPPISEPEGAILGAQYVGIVNGGRNPSDFRVDPAVPPALLAGTGWHVGTVLPALLAGEGDATDVSAGGIPVMVGHAIYGATVITANASVRTSPAGARVFDAGTFAWCNALSPDSRTAVLLPGGFERFTLNVLAWLGLHLA